MQIFQQIFSRKITVDEIAEYYRKIKAPAHCRGYPISAYEDACNQYLYFMSLVYFRSA